jgi:hypothetical protein
MKTPGQILAELLYPHMKWKTLDGGACANWEGTAAAFLEACATSPAGTAVWITTGDTIMCVASAAIQRVWCSGDGWHLELRTGWYKSIDEQEARRAVIAIGGVWPAPTREAPKP